MAERLRVVGQRLPLAEAYEKVSGRAEYCSTMQLPGMLVGKVLRSPHPHARVLSIDASKARALPGVQAVVTRDDVPRKMFTWNVMTYQLPGGEINDMLLFDDKMRYKGDTVAAVAAVDEPTANAALALIDVEYEILPAVFTVDQATASAAPTIHDFAPDNVPVPFTPVFCYGDAQQGFADSYAVVEGDYTTTKQVQAGMEIACSVADFSKGRLTVWSQIQLPHMAKRMLAHVLDLPESRVRLVQPHAGCGFGAGTDMHNEPVCAALAMEAGAPVKLWYTRSEDFNNRVTREHVSRISMKIGVAKDGTPKALQARYVGDAGAYMCKTASGCGVSLASNITEYEFESMHQEITAVYTNHIGGGAMRGFGGPQSSFVRETLVDEVCEQIGMDPLEFRLKYHRRPGGLGWFPSTQISSCGVEECLRIGAERIGWYDKRGKKLTEGTRVHGVGTAIMAWLSGAQPMLMEHSNATLKFNADGGATLIVSPGMMGQGILGTLAQMAAETLGLEYGDINVLAGDTDITGFDIGTHASRGVYCIGKAVVAVSEKARDQFLARGAEKLDVAMENLEMKDRQVRSKLDPEKTIAVADLALDMIYSLNRDCVQVVAHATVEPTDFAPPWQAGFAEVAVDIETGVVDVVKWVTVHDIGLAINPMVVEGQLEGATAQGLGFALWEDPVVSDIDGTMLADSFERYRLPAIIDMPEHEAMIVELGDPTGPFGAKSVGESGMFLQAPAIANAIYDAVGVRLRDLPLTPERVFNALHESGSANRIRA